MNKVKDNIVPFPIQERSEIVDILLCTKCGGSTFFLLAEESNRVACCPCENVTEALWFPGLST